MAFSSPKGGVGKTTLAAHVAIGLHGLGWGVVAMDFDSQNSLRLPFGVALEDGHGYVAAWDRPETWPSLARQTGSGAHILPYGDVGEAERMQFERCLLEEPHYLAAGLGPILEQPDWVIVADLPPGPAPALRALDRVSALHVAVLLADATSLSLLPQVERGALYGEHPPFVVLNQVDPRRRLSRSVSEFVASRVPDQLIGQICRDEAVAEAVGWQRPVYDHAPASAAARDFRALAERISDLLRQSALAGQAGARGGEA
ncbi:cellulose synthase operon protein YhjQ/BcsQ [Zavarzinia compransoris]|uniref:cellulose synthase operon protein YhjQ/BcsQ n=1 Tax=Zavarzinia compransoris TaxID=1264899 RepID=UPI001AAD8964|nr:cellulose synthase operon protein YhjQ/BcsQ [Zavarzinia compransoris]